MQISWLALSLGALATWGVWGVFGKIASGYLDGRSLFFYQLATGLVVVFIAFAITGFRPQLMAVPPATGINPGIKWAIATGVVSALGQILYFSALGKGKASIVVLMTGLYPVVTILLAFFILKETITWTQGAGIFLAIVSMTLLSL